MVDLRRQDPSVSNGWKKVVHQSLYEGLFDCDNLLVVGTASEKEPSLKSQTKGE